MAKTGISYVLNGQGHGSVANRLLATGFDPGALRPYIGKDGRSYVSVANEEGKQEVRLINNAATLTKDEWIHLDTSLRKVAKPRLKLVESLTSLGLTRTVPNGMGKTKLEFQAMSDINEADISMDAIRRTDRDRPVVDLNSIPLPIIHKDFSFSARELYTARQSKMQLDTSMGEMSARRVSEIAEKLVLGTYGTYTFGGGTLYGLVNYPNRITKTLTAPTASGWTPATLLAEVMNMKQASVNAYHYGPWVLYVSTAWDEFMDDDYSAAKGDITLRERLAKITGINSIQTLDYLTNYDMVLMQISSEGVQVVNFLPMQTIQWETEGGMELHWKIMYGVAPLVRKDYNSNMGLVHGSV